MTLPLNSGLAEAVIKIFSAQTPLGSSHAPGRAVALGGTQPNP